MSRGSSKLLRTTLAAMHRLHADDLIAPLTRGRGVIFTLHHVTPEQPEEFAPNRILKITPEFLESVIVQVQASGFDIIALDDVPARLSSASETAPFAVFTLDDGYRDNREHAYPVFKRHGVPFTIYVPTDYPDGDGELWWLALEESLKRLTALEIEMDGENRHFDLSTPDNKTDAFESIYWWLRGLPEERARAVVRALSSDAGVDTAQLCRDLVMTWDEIRDLARDPLVTIGAHTRSHYALAKLSASRARSEIADSVARIEAELGKPCRHFSYPYGCEQSAAEREFEITAELGLATAVTTRKSLLHAKHANALTALPRLSLNGDFQDVQYVKVLLSGLPFALLDASRRIKRPASAAAAVGIVEGIAAPISTLVAAL